MKNKLIILFSILCIVSTIQAQIIDESTQTQLGYTVLNENIYNTIKFEGVLFTDIKATHGAIDQMTNLFPVDDDNQGPQQSGYYSSDPNSVNIEEPGAITGDVYREFHYQNGLSVTFFGEDEGDDLEIIDLESDNITINGVMLEIGDPITDLTSINYTIRTGTNNNQLVSIFQSGFLSVTLTLELDSNDCINRIHYYRIP